MIKLALFVSLCCAQVAINDAQMSSLVMKALGVNIPDIPTMPASLKAFANSQKQQQQQQQQQQQKRIQQQRMARMRALQLRRIREDAKKNPYSIQSSKSQTGVTAASPRPIVRSNVRSNVPSSLRSKVPSNVRSNVRSKVQSSARQGVRPSTRQNVRTANLQNSRSNVRQSGRQQAYNRRNYRKLPYSSAYRTSQRAQNSVYSPANAVRRPSSQQLLAVKPASNPYGSSSASSKKSTSSQKTHKNPYTVSSSPLKTRTGNPYSTSRQVSSNNPAIRNKAIMDRQTIQRLKQQRANQMRAQRMKMAMKKTKMVSMVKKVMEQPKKVMEAMGHGCMSPEGPMAGMMKISSCKNPALRMVCTMSMKQCVTIGIGAMCCPPGVNQLTMDTMSYMNKMQKFMQQMEGLM